MIETERNCERLYLNKDNENEIYVDNSQNLKQHQIDSLRFLYRQFVKKKKSAVLNFPAGSGKSLVVTLFLNALSSRLKERVLILCVDDEEIVHWKQLFLTWTDYKNDDITVESSNPRLRKKIFLKKAEDLTSYLRCHWGVVVIKDERMCKTLQKVVLEADLKIWITSTDIKKDISLLLFIYNWMFPKSNINININEIITNQTESKHKMFQSIILDTLLEDFVLRENKLKVIKETKNSEMLKIYKDNNKKGTTRKNKDATGNKIKKSKRSIDDEPMEQTNNLPEYVNISTKIKEEPEISGNDLMDMDIDDKSGINDEVREEKPEISGNLINIQIDDKSHDIDVKIDTVQASEDDSFNLLQINQNHTIKTERNTEETLDFQPAVNDIVVNENDVQCVDENSTESIDFGGEENLNSTKTLGFEGTNKNSNATESLDFGDCVEEKLNSTESLDLDDNTEIILDDNILCIDKSDKFEDKHLDNISHVKDKENDIKIDLDTNSVRTEKSEMKCNLDFKMSELEESTMKKFKGSLLDSLF